MRRFAILTGVCLLLAGPLPPGRALAAEKPLKVLFLGDDAGHQPVLRHRLLQPVLAARGIDLTYTGSTSALDPKILAGYDALLIYANHTTITPQQEAALLDYVASGKGFVPVHCASYCFLNSPKYVELVGAQFQKHGTGVFRTRVTKPDHPVVKDFSPFESWDETYHHTKHNDTDRIVLEVRREEDRDEPWTWVRTHGKGRVFYTAWGHDPRTWSNPGFHNLIERGVRWATGGDPALAGPFKDGVTMTPLRKGLPPFEYAEAKVPFYPASDRWGTMGKPITQMQLPATPARSVEHFVTPTDFEVKLFVAEDKLGGKPIALNWDEKGRLWALIMRDYPNELQPEGKGRDRIVVCEDTDGDGVCDKVTTFADKLSIPTSLTFANGGVIVHQAPHTLFLKDTDGDGVADVRKILFSGWSTGDTHAGPSNLVLGFDNWVYGMVGYAGFEGTVGGERHSFRTGFYRFRPDGSKMEFLRNTSNNSWGVGFSEDGLLFGSTANGNPSVYLPIPNRYYEKVKGWSSSVLGTIALDSRFSPVTDRVRQVDYHGKFTAAAGHALYTARAYPKEYWNRTAFVAEPTGHLVATFQISRAGSDFVSRNAFNLLASDDEWSAPIVAEVGPDGNVWVIDWYNYIVQHNPTPVGFKNGKGNAYETELRDKKHGRIYRLVAKGAAGERGGRKPTTLAGATPEQLVGALGNDNLFWRRHAQRLLVERGLVERGERDVVPALMKRVQDRTVDAIGLNPGAIHALWTLHGLGAVDGAAALEAVVSALKHPSAGVRMAAVNVLPRTAAGRTAVLKAGALEDSDSHVRQAGLLALAEMPASADAGAAVVAVLMKPENLLDRWLPDAATAAAAGHDLGFLKGAAQGKGPGGERYLEVIRVVARHHAAGATAKSVAELLAALAEGEPAVAGAVVTGLAAGWPGKPGYQGGKPLALDEAGEKALARVFGRVPSGQRGALVKLAGAWGSKALAKHAAEVTGSLLATVGDDKQTDDARLTAARHVVEFNAGSVEVAGKLLEQVSPRTPPALAAGLIEALSGSSAENLADLVIRRLAEWTPAARSAGLRLLLSRPDTTRALLTAAEKGGVTLDDLTLDQKQALLAHPSVAIAKQAKAALARAGGLPSADRQKVVEELMPLTRVPGAAAKGKPVYTKHCAACHVYQGEGAKIGPDLTGMAAHPKAELLVHIIDPSRSVEGNYRVYTVTTEDGRVLTGLLASETRTAVEVADAQGKKHTLHGDNISSLVASSKSLMPEGFEKQMSKEELTDLLEFLTQKGKYLPLPLDKVATVVSTKGMFISEDGDEQRLIFPDWGVKTFRGVPFYLVDPRGDRQPNVVMLHSRSGTIPNRMPRSVSLPVNTAAKGIHLLSGVSGWGCPASAKGSISMTVRLTYADDSTEDHPLRNGEHFADYIRRVDVPGSAFAFALRGQQIRYLTVTPKTDRVIKSVELIKGPDAVAPVVMAVTVEVK